MYILLNISYVNVLHSTLQVQRYCEKAIVTLDNDCCSKFGGFLNPQRHYLPREIQSKELCALIHIALTTRCYTTCISSLGGDPSEQLACRRYRGILW